MRCSRAPLRPWGEILCGIASLGKDPAGVFHKKIFQATIRVGDYLAGRLRRAWKTSGEQAHEVSMELKDRVIVVTGAARGIGRALATRFASAEPLAVFVADIDGLRLTEVAQEIGATAIQCDVSRETDIHHLITHVESTHGRIDIFCSNAGVAVGGGPETSNDQRSEERRVGKECRSRWSPYH